MRVLRWAEFVPDFEDNRARHAAGRPALVVELRQPTAAVWLRFRRAILEDPEARTLLVERIREYGEQGALRILVNDERFGSLLWAPCVGKVVSWPADMAEGLEAPPAHGADLWALRDTLSAGALYASILEALVVDGMLEEGLAVPLASPSGPSPAQTTAPVPAGTAVPAGVTV